MKKLIALALALIMVLCMVACSNGGKEKDKVTITYVTLGDTGMAKLEEAAAAFEKETGIKVVFESWSYSDAYQKILTAAEGKQLPDAMYGFSSWTQQFKEAGYTVAFDGLISDKLYNDFSQAAREVCSVDGKMWAMPSYMSVRSLLINTESLKAAGVEAPKTWEEMLKIAPKLCDNGVTKYAYTLVAGHPKNTLDTFLPILWAYDSDVLSADGKTAAFNTPEGVAALQMFVDLSKYAVPSYGEDTINETQSNFTTQTAAAYIHNGQGLAALEKEGKTHEWAEIVMPLAGPTGKAYSYGVMDVDLLFKNGHEKETAQWLEFWHQAQYMGEVTKASGFVPNQASIISAVPDFTDPSNALVAPFVAMEGQAKFKPSITCWEEIQKIMADHITKAVFGEETPEAAWAAAETECNAVLSAS